MSTVELITALRKIVSKYPPSVKAYLYGSTARGERNENSDVDLLILSDNDQLSLKEESLLTDPLYDFEFQSGIIMSPVVMTRKKWNSLKSSSSFYHFVEADRISL